MPKNTSSRKVIAEIGELSDDIGRLAKSPRADDRARAEELLLDGMSARVTRLARLIESKGKKLGKEVSHEVLNTLRNRLRDIQGLIQRKKSPLTANVEFPYINMELQCLQALALRAFTEIKAIADDLLRLFGLAENCNILTINVPKFAAATAGSPRLATAGGGGGRKAQHRSNAV